MVIIYGMNLKFKDEVRGFIDNWSEYVDIEIYPMSQTMDIRFRKEIPISYKHYGGCGGITEFFYLGDRTFAIKKSDYEKIVCN